jgi:hypothetical protein
MDFKFRYFKLFCERGVQIQGNWETLEMDPMGFSAKLSNSKLKNAKMKANYSPKRQHACYHYW